jgi:hypothetical protein
VEQSKPTPPLNSKAPPADPEVASKYVRNSFMEMMRLHHSDPGKAYLYFENFINTIVNTQGSMMAKGVLEDILETWRLANNFPANSTPAASRLQIIREKYETIFKNAEDNLQVLYVQKQNL